MQSAKKYFEWFRLNFDLLGKLILFTVMVILLVRTLPTKTRFAYDFQRGRPWQYDILISPFDFSILKSPDQLKEEQGQILQNFSPWFRKDMSVAKTQRDLFVSTYQKEISGRPAVQLHMNEAWANELKLGQQILDTLYGRGVIEAVPEIEGKSPGLEIFIVEGSNAVTVPLGNIYTMTTAAEYIKQQASAVVPSHEAAFVASLTSSLKHNVVYDEAITRISRDEALSAISQTHGMVQTGERIISRGEVVNEQKFQILQSLKEEYIGRQINTTQVAGLRAGQIILVTFALLSLILFLFSFRKDIFSDNKRLLLILLMFYAIVLATSLISRQSDSWIYAIPFAILPVLLRVFFDTRVAFFTLVTAMLVVGFIVPNSFFFIFMQIVTGVIAIVSVATLRRRSQFFITALAVLLTSMIIYAASLLIQDGSFQRFDPNMLVMLSVAALLTLFAYPIIYIIEKTFGMVTDVTLMELIDTNSPLLRLLSQLAPGTFQHSMQVANLAEAAAYEIGGDTLLIRAGALYHDIGKTEMPLYFIENQSTGVNPHDELPFEESARIIISHVIRGVEIAKKHKLPEAVIDFIRTHHGTTYTRYFYNKQYNANPAEADVKHFTYPGPTPFSKETSVLMLADTVEAASRSLKKPTAESISELVETLSDSLIENKQFVNSELSLKEITAVKKVLKKKLMSIYHIRIEYPTIN